MNGPSGPEHRGNASGRKHIYIKKRAGRMRPARFIAETALKTKKAIAPEEGWHIGNTVYFAVRLRYCYPEYILSTGKMQSPLRQIFVW